MGSWKQKQWWTSLETSPANYSSTHHLLNGQNSIPLQRDLRAPPNVPQPVSGTSQTTLRTATGVKRYIQSIRSVVLLKKNKQPKKKCWRASQNGSARFSSASAGVAIPSLPLVFCPDANTGRLSCVVSPWDQSGWRCERGRCRCSRSQRRGELHRPSRASRASRPTHEAPTRAASAGVAAVAVPGRFPPPPCLRARLPSMAGPFFPNRT